ncbi:LOW QUALITY PROTEIN: caveolin-1-like [Hemitrygon akajei]|uniref:LOW QUALITY PROTEIN: caveolin-1-like n=1 Tax=Hemitrygon akajei TaxID=2704970 RepID=UPI003BF99824
MAEEVERKEAPHADTHTKEIDLVKRDPKHLNDEIVKVELEEVVAEPEGYHSVSPVWRLTHTTFTVSEFWCYRLMTAIFGVPMAVLWGFLYACASFWQVWAAVPCLRCALIELYCLASTYPACLRAVCDPLSNAAGGLLLSVRLALRKES